MRITALLVLLPLVAAAPTKRAITPIYDGSTVNGRTYDYVIAGGGLAGVVVAKRLTEDGGRSVLVIEAGYDEEGRADVTDASKYQSTFGTWLDWQYQTVAQTSADGQPQTMRSGRALGGSATINGMAWTKPHSFQIDAMEDVGNPGLNWNSLQPYMLRVEDFTAPSSSMVSAGVSYTGSCHGGSGPIGVEYSGNAPQDLEHNLNTTEQSLGLPYATDLSCGNPAGLATVLHTQKGNLRSDAYRGYLYGQTIPNLTILAGANVGKVLLSSDATPRATGVEFQDEKGNTYTVSAGLEVIMATGAIKTPVILQHSGIGPTSVLQSAGITQVVDLPVGQNLIDQTTTTTDWSFSGNSGGAGPISFPRFQDLFKGADAATTTNMLQNDLASYAQDAVNNGAASTASALQTVLEIQRDWILNKGAGMSENYEYSFGNTMGFDSWYLLPFGRGSIRVSNNQPYSNSFTIDPRYFSNPFDRMAQGATARFTRTVSTTSPLANQVTGEQVPGSAVSASLNDWSNWAANHYRSNWHPIGTVAMMSRDLDGSVDSRNRVYGVTALRVVDASTLPFQVSSHLMSVVYGLAERAAELIKEDNSGNSGPAPSSSSSPSPSSTSSPAPSATSTAGVAIHPNGDNTKCLQVQGSLTNGAAVVINDCNGTPQQKWTFSNTAVKVAGQNFCLDAGTSPASGTKMKVWQCYDNLPAQSWSYANSNIKLQSQNQCVDLTDGSKANGNVVQIWECSTNGNPNQKWTV